MAPTVCLTFFFLAGAPTYRWWKNWLHTLNRGPREARDLRFHYKLEMDLWPAQHAGWEILLLRRADRLGNDAGTFPISSVLLRLLSIVMNK
jgi:hypothetical protein